MINDAETIEIEDIILRKPKKEDIKQRFIYGRPLEFRKNCGGSMVDIPPFTLEDADNWFYKVSDHPFTWIIEVDGKMIGTASITKKDDEKARYAIGIYDNNYYNKGIGTKVTKTVINYVFNKMNYNFIDLIVFEFNKRAIACYQKCGFKTVKKIENHALIDDVYYNDLIMEIKKGEDL